ncbi:MAG: hypothetical protein ABSA41_20850 [Terriglobia bacterium]
MAGKAPAEERMTMTKEEAAEALADHCPMCGHVYRRGDPKEQDEHLGKCQEFREFMAQVEEAELILRQGGRLM